MAVRISNFEIAADDAEKVDIAENVVELQHGAGRFSLWRKPTAGQYTMFQLRTSRSSGFEQARGLDRFFSALVLTPAEAVENDRLDADGVTYAQRVKDGDEAVGMEFFLEMIERGVMDDDVLIAMLREVVEIHSGFPTSSQPGSSAGRGRSGPPSTAASRRAASTRSRSSSDDS